MTLTLAFVDDSVVVPINATNLNAMVAAINAATPGAWTAYTPTWSGTLGNGTIVSKYALIGKTVHYRIKVTWGSTTSHAAATQSFSLPVPAHAELVINMPAGIAAGGAASSLNGIVIFLSNAAFCIMVPGGTTFWSNTIPVTWANTNTMTLAGTYEAA